METYNYLKSEVRMALSKFNEFCKTLSNEEKGELNDDNDSWL